MPADRIHLIRHGEVHNPGGVLYGRLPHFRLSELGHVNRLVVIDDHIANGAEAFLQGLHFFGGVDSADLAVVFQAAFGPHADAGIQRPKQPARA